MSSIINVQQATTILAALRYFQANYNDAVQHTKEYHFTEIKPLSPKEIDKLCENVNCGEFK